MYYFTLDYRGVGEEVCVCVCVCVCACVCEGEKGLNKWNHGKNIEIFYHEGDVVFGHSL